MSNACVVFFSAEGAPSAKARLRCGSATAEVYLYGAHCVSRPVLVAPAMNTFMWHQRITSTHVAALRARGVLVVPPIAKKLACGDTGMGAMAEVGAIVEAALGALRRHADAEHAAAREGRPTFVP